MEDLLEFAVTAENVHYFTLEITTEDVQNLAVLKEDDQRFTVIADDVYDF